ncbi:phage tail fiber protein [Rhizobium leguminosarum]|uniref:phage tail fiber protein n=1 Tax=Rhizobium leguminosarum TaxID=384 RepID=UPI000414ECF1|nr:hypothetical protein [Rhizobium leguminosarum]
MATITSANAIVMLSIPGLFDVPQQIQGFSADNIYTQDTLEVTQTSMGVDGKLSGGFVFTAVSQTFTLQADSPSNVIFDTWAQNQRLLKDVYVAQGRITLPSIGFQYVQTKGFLISYPPLPSAAKTLQPRAYQIQWESVVPQPN